LRRPTYRRTLDWYEAVAEIGGERRKVWQFAMRSMASGGAFHRSYYHATQQAFLEAHEFAVRYFGGVFRRLRYDNLKSAVRKILRGYQREETEHFIAFRSHWGFQAEFCNPARGNEKGGVEGEAGYSRRNHLVPIPQVKDLEELNELLLEGCRADEQRRIAGKLHAVGEAIALGSGRFRSGGDQLPGGGRQRVREGAHELVFDAAPSGDAPAREAAAGVCGDLAGAGMRGAA
jgi:hypothetical protein